MAGFEPITKPEQLPEPGTALETLARDFKRLLPSKTPDPEELAKDVAAFANRVGGVLLLGAAEDKKRGTLGRYQPISDVDAKGVRDACSKAVAALCSPKPIFESERIRKDGGFVVAINIWPFPGQAIGVRRAREADAYVFPMRTGIDCVYLKPEQLPMLMIPELRRIVALLYAIPPGEDVMVLQPNGPRQKFRFLRVDEVKNVVVLEHPQGSTTQRPFNIALDSVASVWCDESGIWQIHRR